MQVKVSGRHVEISDALRSHLDSRLAKLKSHFERVIDVNVVLSVEKHRHIAEITVHANGLRIHGKESSDDMYGSVDAVVEKLDRQIEKYKTRIKDYQPRKAAARKEVQHNVIQMQEAESGNGNGGGATPKHHVVKHEKLDMKPMMVEEAVLQLELANDSFLMFTNAETHQVNVLYPLADGNYGLLEPEF